MGSAIFKKIPAIEDTGRYAEFTELLKYPVFSSDRRSMTFGLCIDYFPEKATINVEIESNYFIYGSFCDHFLHCQCHEEARK